AGSSAGDGIEKRGDELVQIGRRVGNLGANVRRDVDTLGTEESTERIVGGPPSRNRFEQHHAEAEPVGGSGEGLAAHLLGRNAATGADENARTLRLVATGHKRRREPEVQEADATGGRHYDSGRL